MPSSFLTRFCPLTDIPVTSGLRLRGSAARAVHVLQNREVHLSNWTKTQHDIHGDVCGHPPQVLLFFAALFVLVECLGELGVIRTLGAALADIIKSVDIDNRLSVAMVLMLWVSGIGSAFLESLPYTTTVCYILLNLENDPDLGIPTKPLAYALSVGACVGGIGR